MHIYLQVFDIIKSNASCEGERDSETYQSGHFYEGC